MGKKKNKQATNVMEDQMVGVDEEADGGGSSNDGGYEASSCTDILGAPSPETPDKYPPNKKLRKSYIESDILSAISALSMKHDHTFKKVSSIEKTANSTSHTQESLSSIV